MRTEDAVCDNNQQRRPEGMNIEAMVSDDFGRVPRGTRRILSLPRAVLRCSKSPVIETPRRRRRRKMKRESKLI